MTKLSDARDPILLYRFGVFELDVRSRELRRRGVLLDLNGKPFDLLQGLLEAGGAWVSRDSIVSEVWGVGNRVTDASINQAIMKVRRALGDSARTPRFIESGRHQGYRFVAGTTTVRTSRTLTRGSSEPPARESTQPPVSPERSDERPDRLRVAHREAGDAWKRVGFLPSGAFLIACVAIALLMGTAFWTDARSGEFHVSFDAVETSPENLRRMGFGILNHDPQRWITGNFGSGLVLTTERGDLWRKPDDPVLPPTNMLVRLVTSKWYSATTEIAGIHPESPWQQAGIVVLGDDEKGDYVRLTVGNIGACPTPSLGVSKVLEIRKTGFRRTAVACLEGQPGRIELGIERRGDEFRFRYRASAGSEAWQSMEEVADELPIGQRWVGLLAFQGITSPAREPLDQPSVEVRFKELSIAPPAG